MRALWQPAIALMGWTMIMWLWMYATRIPAMRRHAPDMMTGHGEGSLDERLPAAVQWKAKNYNHLMEQPTLFYAVVAALSALQETSTVVVALAWTYVGLRVAHSLWQALVNHVPVRFFLFTLGSGCLAALIVGAARAAWQTT